MSRTFWRIVVNSLISEVFFCQGKVDVIVVLFYMVVEYVVNFKEAFLTRVVRPVLLVDVAVVVVDFFRSQRGVTDEASHPT